MKLLCAGVKRIVGVAKVGGAPFDMCSLLAMVPVEPGTGKVSISGFGYELSEVRLEPAALDRFSQVKFPVVIDLLTDVVPFRGRLETTVVGIAVPTARMATA